MTTNFDFSKPVYIGSDHAGYVYKARLVEWLRQKGLQVQDLGTFGPDSVDYPDFAHPVAEAVGQGKAAFGILLCGTGNGVCITANKHAGVRAALCWDSDVAKLVRQHNDANLLCMPARFISLELAFSLVEIFINTDFEGGRHARRVEKMSIT